MNVVHIFIQTENEKGKKKKQQGETWTISLIVIVSILTTPKYTSSGYYFGL